MLISLSAARQRTEPRRADADPAAPRLSGASAVDLEALRAAGF